MMTGQYLTKVRFIAVVKSSWLSVTAVIKRTANWQRVTGPFNEAGEKTRGRRPHTVVCSFNHQITWDEESSRASLCMVMLLRYRCLAPGLPVR